MHRLSWNDAWSFQLDSLALVGVYRAFTIDWVSKGVNDSSQNLVADGYINNCSCSFDDISLFADSLIDKGLAAKTIINY